MNDSANATREIDGSDRAERDARPVQAVILDLDDTLFDHRASALLGVGRLIHELGTPPTQALLDSWERNAEQLMNRRRAGEIDRDGYRHGRVRALLHDLGRPDAAALADDAAEHLYDRFLALYEQEWVPFDDAVPALRALHERGIPVAILTNGPEERQQRKARELGLRDWGVGVWTSESLAARKPDAETYLQVCAALEEEPGDVLHVGDDLRLDREGAEAAGLQALHLHRGARTPLPPRTIAGLPDLLRAL